MGSTVLLSHNIPSGELLPPPPRVCFGRDELIKRIIGLVETLAPIALIGPGGIGKTSIALTVLHHNCIKEWFGGNCWFIRCDQFPASHAHFLSQLSKVIGAGVKNPKDLTPLRPFLSSRKMILCLDNVESILDPSGKNSPEIYAAVEELSQFGNICLCITSRISTIPPDFKCLDIPTLSMDAACHAFYHIYGSDKQSDLVSSILEKLDFHPLSITLLATVACHNKWDTNRLAREWDRQQTGMLHIQNNKSLAATIELSLASLMFQELGPNAHDLLGVIAFFPQGIDENNLSWLFPTISNRSSIFDKFCILSLTYQSNGFITMLAPLRDYLCPKDPKLSPLLCITKECYFSRLSVDLGPDEPGFEKAQWIVSEDVNVEHLLNVFTSIDANSIDVWAACCSFMRHLYWHKSRLVILGPKFERLPDNHHSKPLCLLMLSWLFESVGNYVEYKRLLIDALKLWREWGDDSQVTQTLRQLAEANLLLGLYKEGIPYAKEALEICEQSNAMLGQADSLYTLAQLLHGDNQLDAAEGVTLQTITLLQAKGKQFRVCKCHRLLGEIYHSKGETEKAISHFQTALRIASSSNWPNQLSRNHYSLAVVFSSKHRLNDAHAHVEHAKSHATNNPRLLGRAMHLQAQFWYGQLRLEEAKSEASGAIDVYENIGAMKDAEDCRALVRDIEREMKKPVTTGESNFSGKFLVTALLPTYVDSQSLARGTE